MSGQIQKSKIAAMSAQLLHGAVHGRARGLRATSGNLRAGRISHHRPKIFTRGRTFRSAGRPAYANIFISKMLLNPLTSEQITLALYKYINEYDLSLVVCLIAKSRVPRVIKYIFGRPLRISRRSNVPNAVQSIASHTRGFKRFQPMSPFSDSWSYTSRSPANYRIPPAGRLWNDAMSARRNPIAAHAPTARRRSVKNVKVHIWISYAGKL